MEPPVSVRQLALAGVVLLLVGSAFLLAVGAIAPGARASGTNPVNGSLTGPTLVSTNSKNSYEVAGYGGPATAPNGSVIGTVAYYTTLVGPNLTGVSFSPPHANFTNNRTIAATLQVGNASETLTIDVEISSTYQGKNQSTNFTYTVNVAQPYVVSATIVDASTSTVSSFAVQVTLDGTVVGTVTVPTIQAGGKYQLTFDYPTLGLSSGDHTFGISLAQEHGLVTFTGGATQYYQAVYITGPGPDYTLWYIAGIAAFFGAIFIFATRVAARRRGATRR